MYACLNRWPTVTVTFLVKILIDTLSFIVQETLSYIIYYFFQVVNFMQNYSAKPQPTTNYSYLNAIAMGNLNGDSVIDMAAVYRSSDRLVVWLGYGNGTFVDGTPYTTDSMPYDLSLIDMTDDGQLDIVVLCYNSLTINLFVNQGSGIFAGKQVRQLQYFSTNKFLSCPNSPKGEYSTLIVSIVEIVTKLVYPPSENKRIYQI
jgi:hypothetical protein